jgi:hypothetical protein
VADRSAEDEVDEDDERPLKLKLVSSEKGGKALACSRLMIIEAKWLLKYTAQWNREGMLLYAGIARHPAADPGGWPRAVRIRANRVPLPDRRYRRALAAARLLWRHGRAASAHRSSAHTSGISTLP